jgi:uncharacterized protein (DUF1800 family)
MRLRHVLAICALLAALAGCGGGAPGGGTAPPPPPPPVVTKAEAFRFLNQATLGATESEAARVINLGYEGWITEQLERPASLELPHVQSLPRPVIVSDLQRDRIDVWFRNALRGNDQLRQRMAFALSEILVVSQVGALDDAPYALASYYDLLATRAFGNFRDLLETVTLHPAMGVYLSMLGNQKPNAAANIRPDENYARELMQLFSIGLVELNDDGTTRRDTNNRPIPAYTQPVIEAFAHVYTGWNYAGAVSFLQAERTDQNQVQPMQLYPDFHDTGSKRLLGNTTLPAGQSGAQDLDGALDNIFAHANVGPFLATRLIQRLVGSNPSPAYVARVVTRFNNNGSGVRGDLAAVVRAILLDTEARTVANAATAGKLKEPLLRITQFWRAYNGQAANGSYAAGNPATLLGQGPLQSPSVFNFFSPFYSPPGELRAAGLVAPELQIANEFLNTVFVDIVFDQCFNKNSESQNLEPEDVKIDISAELGVAANTTSLIDMVAGKLLGGVISSALRTEVAGMVDRIPSTDGTSRAAETIYFIVTSPEFALQN